MMSLSADPKKWKECIETAGKSCLCSPTSAKSVKNVLSRAGTRGPQKTLCQSVLPFVSEIINDAAGISILTSLVLYGTPATVEHVAREVVKVNPTLWGFKKATSCTEQGKLDEPLSQLLDGFIYRIDGTGETCLQIRNSLKNCKESCFNSVFTLPGVGRLMSNDKEFREKVEKNKGFQQAFAEAATKSTTRASAGQFCDNSLTEGDENDLQKVSQFLLNALAPKLKNGSEDKPHECVLISITSKGDPSILQKIGELISKWSNLHELAQREGFTKIISDLLERGDKKIGEKLVKEVVNSTKDIDERIRSRKGPGLRLLSIIAKHNAYTKAVSAATGVDQGAKLHGAAVLYEKISGARPVTTRNAIQEKLKLLGEKDRKRPRDHA